MTILEGIFGSMITTCTPYSKQKTKILFLVASHTHYRCSIIPIVIAPPFFIVVALRHIYKERKTKTMVFNV